MKNGVDKFRKALIAYFALQLLLVIGISGCGSTRQSGAGSKETVDITISWQPVSQSTPIGQTATFVVKAQGATTLSYQWYKDGTAISGATSAIYTTQPLSSANNGSAYKVMLSDASGTISSSTASLSSGPRTPRSDDLRFKGVGMAETLPLIGSEGVPAMASTSINGTIGAPLQVGDGTCASVTNTSGNCSWLALLYKAPATQLVTAYYSDSLANLQGALSAINLSGAVITSLDEHPLNGVFAMSTLTNGNTDEFKGEYHSIQSAHLQTAATTEGSMGRIITAISANTSGQLDYLSYGLTGDDSTYDELCVFASNDQVEAQASYLASLGYIVTAIGRSGSSNGFVLVGTRVDGDSLPRPFGLFHDFTSGYAVVGYVFDSSGNTYFGEK